MKYNVCVYMKGIKYIIKYKHSIQFLFNFINLKSACSSANIYSAIGLSPCKIILSMILLGFDIRLIIL